MFRGEIWLVNLEPTIDSEIRKTRPCAIVNDDAIGVLPLKIIVPITDWKESFSIRPWMVRIEPNNKNGQHKVLSQAIRLILLFPISTYLNQLLLDLIYRFYF